MSLPKCTQKALWGVNLLVGLGIVVFAVFSFVLTKAAASDLPSPLERPATPPIEEVKDVDVSAAENPSQFVLPLPVEAGPPTINLDTLFIVKSLYTGTTPPTDPQSEVILESKLNPLSQNTVRLNQKIELRDATGQVFPDLARWKLVKVYADRAVFSNGTETQEIKKATGPGGGPPGGGDPAFQQLAGVPYTKQFKGSQLVGDAPNRKSYVIEADEQKWALANQELLMSQANFQPAQGGLRVMSVQPDSLMADRGFKAEDIVQSVNGIPIATLQDLRDLRNNPKLQGQSFTVMVDRGGQRVTLFYAVQAAPPKRSP